MGHAPDGLATASDHQNALKYRVDRLVAEGGMGRVYDAFRRADGRRVAIKILQPYLGHDERCRHHVRREARALAAVSHPLIVEFLEYGETVAGLPFLVLEWLDGRSLRSLIAEDEPPSFLRTTRIFCSLLDALAQVHVRQVIHADLKPENVMVVPRGPGREEVRLVDFGVASVADEHCARPGEVCGTPGYLAPEILAGEQPTQASDLYSAGVILFEMLTGYSPFPGTSFAETAEQVRAQLPLPSEYRVGVGPRLDAVVARALAQAPEDRFTSAHEFERAFRAASVSTGPFRALRRRATGHRRARAPDAATTQLIRPAARRLPRSRLGARIAR